MFAPKMWNVHRALQLGLPRTNNQLESFHSFLSTVVSKKGQGPYAVTHEIHKNMKLVANDIAAAQSGLGVRKHNALYARQMKALTGAMLEKERALEESGGTLSDDQLLAFVIRFAKLLSGDDSFSATLSKPDSVPADHIVVELPGPSRRGRVLDRIISENPLLVSQPKVFRSENKLSVQMETDNVETNPPVAASQSARKVNQSRGPVSSHVPQGFPQEMDIVELDAPPVFYSAADSVLADPRFMLWTDQQRRELREFIIEEKHTSVTLASICFRAERLVRGSPELPENIAPFAATSSLASSSRFSSMIDISNTKRRIKKEIPEIQARSRSSRRAKNAPTHH